MQIWIDIGEVPCAPIISITVLFVLAKLMGSKQIKASSPHDYIIGISIGSIAAEMSATMRCRFIFPLIAMAVYAIIAIAI